MFKMNACQKCKLNVSKSALAMGSWESGDGMGDG